MNVEISPTMSSGQESNGPEQSSEKGGQKVKKGTIYDELRQIAQNNNSEQDEVVTEQGDINASWKNYSGYGEEYQRRNNERIKTGKVKIDHFGDGDLTIIASINVNQSGNVTSGHDYDPSAESHSDIEASYAQWLSSTPPEQRLIIYEGDTRPEVGSRNEAIIQGTESGLLQFLSKRDGIESISGEPSRAEQASYLAEKGVSDQETTLYYLIRNLTHGSLGKEASEVEVPEDIVMQIYGQAALLGIEGFEEFSEEEKQVILEDSHRMRELRSQGRKLAESMNRVLAEMGLPTFQIGTAEDPDKVTFKSAHDIIDLAESWNPSNQTGRLAEIQRFVTECRDKYLFSLIVRKIREGKKPFVAYGGSHVMSLEPVLEAHFNK